MFLILGDFNAKVRKEETFKPHIRKHNLHELLNDNGQQLVILQLLKSIWKKVSLPKEWNEGTITLIHKKGDLLYCKNYRGITLLNIIYKLLSNVWRGPIFPYAEDNMENYQCGFRLNRSSTNQLFTIRQLLRWEFNSDMHQLFGHEVN